MSVAANRQSLSFAGRGANERLNDLADAILKRSMTPEDPYEVAALLESMGWNDERAYEAFGVENVFALAQELWGMIRQKVVTSSFSQNVQISPSQMLWQLFKSFLRGLIFALPMAISVVSMLTLKFSLWSYENLSVELATCIAVGTILSFITVGGYTQAIARRGFFYILQGYYKMSRKVTFTFIRYGYITCLIVSAAIYCFNLLFNIFPLDMFMYIILYFFFLNSIWLAVTVMYILRRELTFTGLIIIGIGIVYVLFRIVHLDIIFSQLTSIMVISVAGMLLVFYYFKKAEEKEEKGISPKKPRLSLMIYSIQPYFFYGFLYFIFLFVDRIMAWSANEQYMPYFIWFRGEYELGLDFALLALMVPLGVCEVIVNKLMLDIEASYKRYWAFEADKMNNHFLRVYNRLIVIIALVSIASAIGIYLLVWLLDREYVEVFGKHLIASAKTEFVFIVALAAYAILAVALLNAVFLFSLSQPKAVNQALVPALLLNFASGFLLSRWVDYYYAVFGVVLGSILFLFLSFRAIRQVLSKLDFHLYETS